MKERRQTKFIERLSTVLVVVSSIGALLVLIDPVVTFTTSAGVAFKFGGTGFSDQLKGAVISLILVSGFAAVISYWLGASNQGDKAQESAQVIAQQGNTAAVVSGAAATPLKVDEVKIDAVNATVTEKPQQPVGSPG